MMLILDSAVVFKASGGALRPEQTRQRRCYSEGTQGGKFVEVKHGNKGERGAYEHTATAMVGRRIENKGTEKRGSNGERIPYPPVPLPPVLPQLRLDLDPKNMKNKVQEMKAGLSWELSQ
ncbi:Uncharacterized protein Fot_28372 [Forsythia ovata]|uniref:Uncharacterized protein n=1 Tax=Forsythia ovata TaxID=205694 RepID=A0ABD1TNV6_9LAMI